MRPFRHIVRQFSRVVEYFRIKWQRVCRTVWAKRSGLNKPNGSAAERCGERLYSTVYSTHSPVKPSRTFTKCSLAGLSTCSVKNEPLEEGPSNRWDVCYMDRDAQGRQGMDRTAKAQIKQAQNGNTNQARGETSRWDVLHEQLLMSTAVSLYSGHLLHSRDRPV